MYKVYLAGPISGLSYGDATSWRDNATKYLEKHGITALSPMRYKNYLKLEDSIADSYPDKTLSTSKAVVARDRWDCMRADVVLVNLIGALKVSIGTVMEVAWADSVRTPVVLCMEMGNVHTHSMLTECSGWVVPTLDEGLSVVRALLV